MRRILLLIPLVLLAGCTPEVNVVEVPQPYPVVEYRTVEVEKPIYIDRWHEPEIVTVNNTIIKEVIKEVEITRVINNSWREFESLSEFTAWVDGKLTYLMPSSSYTVDCDDYALRLQQEAYKDGYFLSVQLVLDGYLWGKRVTNNTEPHMGNLVVIGNEVFFIEPQPDDYRVIKICDKD
uniref:Uncharacterized protein n=1 Tax=viral metagenome TaxID=1070528 RepID=A0A6M3IVD8_9ZZZZ